MKNNDSLTPEEVIDKLLQCRSYLGRIKEGLVEPHESQNIEDFTYGEPVVVFSLEDFTHLLMKEYR